MNRGEHLLTILNEECVEVAKDCDKALRFGTEDKLTLDPFGPRGTEGATNSERIAHELNDLLGVVQMLVEDGILCADWQDTEKQLAKRKRVESFLEYSKRCGALTP